MTMFQRDDKVYVKLGGNLVVAIVLEVSPATQVGEADQADLVWVKIAVRNPYFVDRWIVTDYPEPVWSRDVSVREVVGRGIVGLDGE